MNLRELSGALSNLDGEASRQVERARECIEDMARDHAEDVGLDIHLRGEALLRFVDNKWREFVPYVYRDLVAD